MRSGGTSIIRAWALALLALVSLLPVQAQATAPQFLIDRWTATDGLPVNAVRNVHYSRSGYLWLATYEGLVRFDGRRFTTFASAESGKRLGELLETPDGLLWVLGDTGRLSSFDGRVFRRHGIADGLPSDAVSSIRLGADGSLWAMTEAGLAQHRDGRFRTAFSAAGTDMLTQALLPIPDGRVLLATKTGLRIWDGKTLRADPAVPESVSALALDAQGRLWLGSKNGLSLKHPDGRIERIAPECGAQRIETAAGHAAAVCWSLSVDVDAQGRTSRHRRSPPHTVNGRERLLGIAPDGSVWRNHIDELSRNGQAVYTSPCEITDFSFSPAGAVWIASTCEGLLRLRPRRIAARTELDGVSLSGVYGLAQSPDGVLWIASAHNGVAALWPNGALRWVHGQHMIGYYGIQADAGGEVWIGSCRVNRDDFRCETPADWPPALGRGDVVRAVHRARDGSLWAGGMVLMRRSPHGEWRSPHTGLQRGDAGQVRAILESGDGTLWFATRGSGLLRRDPQGGFRLFTTADGLSSNAIRAMREDRDGQLWIATEDMGLCRMKARARPRPPATMAPAPSIACLDKRHGLWSDSLNQIVFDAEQRAWINSNQGVFALRRAALDAALDAVADGRSARVHPQVFTEYDGLPIREGNGGVNGAGAMLADGRIAFPTQNGVALIDPARLHPEATAARAVIESVELPGGRSLPVAARLQLATGERNLSVRYTGLVPDLTTQLYFRYRLLPDPQWIELGDARLLSLSHLPPGEKRLELQAFGSSGDGGPPAAMMLVVPPYFHETAAFRLGLPIAFVLAAFALLWRQRRLARRRHAELEATVAARTEDLRSALDTVRDHRNQIERLAMSKSRFFANVSHELRTPLTLISGPLRDAAQGRPLSAQTQAIMLGNARRLERLVTQLLDLERIDAGRFPLRPEPGDIAALLRESVHAFSTLARQQEVSLVARIGATAAPLRHDPDQVARVFGNLLSNALKFTPAGGRIEASLDDDGGTVRIAVADSGPGVPEEWRERIFDRFSQVGSEATRTREGAGLGLSLCREIVQLHGGRLWAETAAGGGAQFVLELPRNESCGTSASPSTPLVRPQAPSGPPLSDEAAPAIPDAAIARPPPGRRILVAEDHPDLRAYIVSILREDYEVLDAVDGEAALQLARQALPDLIVSDVMMPRRDGFSLARELRANAETAGIPLIFLTARASGEDEIAGLACGADQYLKKPFDAALLRAHVGAALHAVERLRRRFAAAAAPPAAMPDSMEPAPAPLAESPAPTPPAAPAPPRSDQPSTADRRLLDAAGRWLEANLHDEHATVQGMADALHVSRATLGRRYTRLTGETPSEALRRSRLDRGRDLLSRNEGTVSEVAYAVGYSSLAAFSHAFRDRFGHPPSRT